jgi:exodeoxyribonuclease III
MPISIASWNINSVRARIAIVERFLREAAPDVLCLQEIKVECGLFPHAAFKALGYDPGGVRLDNVYIPAGGDIADRTVNPKFGQKLDFLERMIGWSGTLATPTILVGDFNIAPLESDVWNHKALLDVVSHTPVEVETLARLQAAANWVDLGRHFTPAPERLYTWWSYRAKDWAESDRGRRLDHMWATPDVAPKATAHRIHEPCRSWDKPSDHIPLVTEFDL